MGKALDLTGHRFGRLVAVAPAERSGRASRWECRCDCGRATVVRTDVLRRGDANGCGCLRFRSHRTHGRTRTPEYAAWSQAKQRCYDTRLRNYSDYGGRGITMCDAWRNDFAAFFRDMGTRPPGHSLDRIDNDGPYSPTNCRWATRLRQQNNTSRNRHVVVHGERLTVAEAARKHGVPAGTIRKRLLLGWSDSEAVGRCHRITSHAMTATPSP